MDNENTPLENQIIIEIQTVKEISEKMEETRYSGGHNFTALKLNTGKRSHFFFRSNAQRTYHAAFSNDKSVPWPTFTNHVQKIRESDLEKFYMSLYDEVIENLGIN
jgi:hypothetical protein